MIARLSGTLLEKKPGAALVEVGGVGYKVLIPLTTYYELGEPGDPAVLRVHTHVREDALLLYGFLTETEETLFQRLISVAGVGPALALKVLSGLEPEELVRAIRGSDLRRLSSIPGVGRKTAERIILELKEKMPELAVAAGVEADGDGARASSLREDLVSALVNLGYPRALVDKPVGQILREESELSFEAALKKVLRQLSA